MLLERGPEVTRRHRCRYTHTPALVNPASRHQAPKRYTEGSSIYEQARTLSCLAMGGNRTMISQAGIAVCTRRFTLTRGAGRRKDSFHHRTVPRKRPHGLTVPAGVPPVLGLRRAKDGAANTIMSEAMENWAVPYSCYDSLFCILERLRATDTPPTAAQSFAIIATLKQRQGLGDASTEETGRLFEKIVAAASDRRCCKTQDLLQGWQIKHTHFLARFV